MKIKRKIAALLLFGSVLFFSACGGGGGGSGVEPDTTAPTVSVTEPVNDATDVTVNTNIIATFSEAINQATITATSFTVNDGSQNISGTVTYSGLNATFNPDSDLMENHTYTATLTTAVTDTSGNALEDTCSWTFTTGVSANTTPPTVSNGAITSGELHSTGGTLTWTKADDDVTAQSALQYRVYRSAVAITTLASMEDSDGNPVATPVNAYTTNIGTLDVTGLSASTTHYLNIVVKDSSGNRSIYSGCSFTTTGTQTGVVKMATSSTDSGSITLNWINPTGDPIATDHIQITTGSETWNSESGQTTYTSTSSSITSNTDYTLTVKTVDPYGNVSANGVTFTFRTSSSLLSADEIYRFIYTAADLNAVRNELADNYIVMNNIDLSGYADWVPIGDVTINVPYDSPTFTGTTYTGVFDGNGYTISNLKITSSSSNGRGLFGVIGSSDASKSATIKNVTLSSIEVSGANFVGGLAAYSGCGNFYNCSVSGNLSGTYYVGGLVGSAKGEMSTGGAFTNCSSSVAVTATGRFTGGLIGYAFYIQSVDGCSSTGAVNNTSTDGNSICIGGLIGHLWGDSETSISNCYTTGAVTANTTNGNRIGGLAGEFTGALASTGITGCLVNNCYASGNVTGGSMTGGLFGQVNIESVTNSYATGTVTGSDMTGGFVGYNTTKMTNCYAEGTVTGATTGSFNTGNPYGVGGFAGVNWGDLTGCYAKGSVTNTGVGCTGGLAGTNFSNLTRCYAEGDVAGTDATGGLVGSNRYCFWGGGDSSTTYNISLTLLNCYAKGTVTGAAYVGGLVGVNFVYNDNSALLVNYTIAATNCYFSGDVNASSTPVQGFLGGIEYEAITSNGNYDNIDVVNSCYFDGDVSGQTDTLASSRTTSEMKTQSTYTGWDFTNVWATNSGEYPHLR